MLVGLDPADGAQRWRVSLGEKTRLGNFGAVCKDGRVHAHVVPERVRMHDLSHWVGLDPATGEVSWRVEVEPSTSTPTRIGERHLFSCGHSQREVNASASTGRSSPPGPRPR